MAKRNPIKTLKSKCDRALQEVFMQDEPYCENKDCSKLAVCAHHFYTKGCSSALRYDWDNLVAVCGGCHTRHHKASDPKLHATVMLKRGEDWYKKITLKKNTVIIKESQGYYKEVYENICQRKSQ